MRHHRWGWLLLAIALSAALLALQGLPRNLQGVVPVDRAASTRYFTPEGAPRPAPQAPKDGLPGRPLPDRFDKHYPGQAGEATYLITLPGRAASAPHVVFFPRAGNQVVWRLNGHWIGQSGTAGNDRIDSAKTPTWLPLPDELLQPTANTLEVTLRAQQGRWSGLSNGLYGPADELNGFYRRHVVMRTGAAMAFGISMLIMGLLALGLWRHERHALYLCFAMAALTGAIPNLDRVLTEVPLDAAVWSTIVAIARAWHIALLCGYLLLLAGVNRGLPWRLVLGYLPLAVLLAVPAKALAMPVLWELCLGLLMPIGLYSLWLVARQAWRHDDRFAWPLLATGLVAMVAAMHDFGAVLLGLPWLRDETHFAILPHATFLTVIVMGWVIVERYARALRDHHDLAQSLEQRVREREASLQASMAALRAREREQDVLNERQRIMRDIHDGVGAHLVGLISLVGPGAERGPLREHAQAALDELRIAVDALQTAGDDLVTVLGTTRYRLQQRFDAVGIGFEWHADAVPSPRSLTPAAMTHIQRILHEALTNVLKHAQARRVSVSLRHDAAANTIVLTVDDDGVGLPAVASTSAGVGLRSMRSRAEAIGGRLMIGRSGWGGATVQLTIPATQERHSLTFNTT